MFLHGGRRVICSNDSLRRDGLLMFRSQIIAAAVRIAGGGRLVASVRSITRVRYNYGL